MRNIISLVPTIIVTQNKTKNYSQGAPDFSLFDNKTQLQVLVK